MRNRVKGLAALVAACALALGPSVAVADDHPPAGAYLELSVVTATGYTYGVDLTCRPAGGAHGSAAYACYMLEMARGDFDALPKEETEQPCTKEFDPVQYRAWGHWLGKPVKWKKWFANPCEGRNATAGVFDF